MAELITQNLGTCNLIKGVNNDIMTRNIAELTDTVDYYRVAIDDNGTVVLDYVALAKSNLITIMRWISANTAMFYMWLLAKITKGKESVQCC